MSRPNILFIMSDNHPADLLGCYGNPEIHTPHLDRFAQQGMQFNQAFCVNAMCSPCRASVLTGHMPSQHGIHTWLDDRITKGVPPNWNAIEHFQSLPEILKTHAYKTALIGKYHLGVPDKPQNGFDHWVTFPHGHTRSFWNNEIICNTQRYTDTGHSVDCFTQHAIDYLNTHNAQNDPPFFLFLTYNAPYGHWPSVQGPAKNRFAHLYENAPMHAIPREGINKAVIDNYELRKHRSGGGIDYTAHLRMLNDLPSLRNYCSQMSMVDDGVGRVLQALQNKGLDQNTLVIYTTDHGYSLGHNGFWGHGQATWPANAHRPAYHIPLLMRHTHHIAPLQTSNTLVSQLDLFATLLHYAGISPPKTPSRSFAPLLQGKPLAWQNEIFIEQEETRAIRTPKWLYVKRFSGSQTYPFQNELYNHQNDPEERHNCIDDSNLQSVVQDLNNRLDHYFNTNTHAKYDLWQGGTLKSNSDKPWLWEDVWGPSWAPVFD